MHGHPETSRLPRLTCTLLHAAFVAVAVWLYFGGGAVALGSWFGWTDPVRGDTGRLLVLTGFAALTFVRILLTFFVLLERKFPWEEFWGVTFALLVYQVGFALFGMGAAAPLGVLDVVAVVGFLLGSYLNTGSELQRKRFKAEPRNRGKLYTGGLFRRVRHVNYLGDLLWVTAWAVVTRSAWALVIPLVLGLGFVYYFIPPLHRHLESKYGAEFEDWRARSKALIPFVY